MHAANEWVTEEIEIAPTNSWHSVNARSDDSFRWNCLFVFYFFFGKWISFWMQSAHPEWLCHSVCACVCTLHVSTVAYGLRLCFVYLYNRDSIFTFLRWKCHVNTWRIPRMYSKWFIRFLGGDLTSVERTSRRARRLTYFIRIHRIHFSKFNFPPTSNARNKHNYTRCSAVAMVWSHTSRT